MSTNKWFASNNTGRRHQLSQQEKLIEQRKKEIESKLNYCSDDQIIDNVIDNNDNNLADNDSDSSVNTNDLNKDIDIKPTINKFKNDGSFFAQFMQMQKQSNDIKPKTETPEDIVVKKEKNIIAPIKMSIKTESTSKLKVVSSTDTSTVKFSDDEEEDIFKVSSPEDKDLRMAIEKAAISVTMNGYEAQTNLVQTMSDNKLYSWLNDKQSLSYKYYEQRIEELTEARKRVQTENFSQQNALNADEQSSSKGAKRARKSRWGDEVPSIQTMTTQDPALVQYAIQVYGKTNLTSDQWKQLDDQRKMSMLFEILKAKQKKAELLAMAGKVRYEYDSDEDIEDGTWEHKRRKLEMTKTKQWADDLTERGSGKHHIGDFIPPDELEKFMQKWENLKEGKIVDFNAESDYKESKIQSDNVGFKMLQKLGWVEGQGLGTHSTGIAEPVNKSAAGPQNAGLGQKAPEHLKEGDDEYEAYRKRMMLAYRFRPNPLNNPRRAYY